MIWDIEKKCDFLVIFTVLLGQNRARGGWVLTGGLEESIASHHQRVPFLSPRNVSGSFFPPADEVSQMSKNGVKCGHLLLFAPVNRSLRSLKKVDFLPKLDPGPKKPLSMKWIEKNLLVENGQNFDFSKIDPEVHSERRGARKTRF